MVRRLIVAGALVALVAAGCSGDDDGSGSAETAESAACEPALPAAAGEYAGANVVGDVEQDYWVVVPPSYEGSTLTALYVLLPGGFGAAQPALAGWRPQFVGLDALIVVPDVHGDAKDVDVIRALVDKVASEYCVDRSRIHAIGGSSSAYFTSQLMAEAPDLVASAGVGIGSFRVDGLEPSVPVPVLAYTGDTNRLVTTQATEQWAEHNGCAREPTTTDLGSGITWYHYEDCAAPVELYDFAGMGHSVPAHDCHGETFYCAEYEEFDFMEAAAEFFAENPLGER